jgi:hypothetical protein
MDKIYIQYHGFVPDSNPFRCVHLNPIPLGNIPRVQKRSSSVNEIGGVRELLDLMEFRQTPSMCVDSKGTLGQSIEVYVTVLALNDNEVSVYIQNGAIFISFLMYCFIVGRLF